MGVLVGRRVGVGLLVGVAVGMRVTVGVGVCVGGDRVGVRVGVGELVGVAVAKGVIEIRGLAELKEIDLSKLETMVSRSSTILDKFKFLVINPNRIWINGLWSGLARLEISRSLT